MFIRLAALYFDTNKGQAIDIILNPILVYIRTACSGNQYNLV